MERPIRFITHSAERLPITHIASETKRNEILVGSNCRIGTKGLQRNVKMGENKNKGIVFMPKKVNNERIFLPT